MLDKNYGKTKKCSSCYWFDECGCNEVCDHYVPLDIELLYIEEYERDLEERRLEYYRLIVEMGGAED